MSRGAGKWQQTLLTALLERGAVPVSEHFTEIYGRSLTSAEFSAIHRAANRLVASGAADWHQVLERDHRGRPTICKWIFNKGKTPKDYGLREIKTRLQERRSKQSARELSVDAANNAEPSTLKPTAHTDLIQRYKTEGGGIVCPRCGKAGTLHKGSEAALVSLCWPCLTDLANQWATANQDAIDCYIAKTVSNT
jgi:hypothetical protein